MATERSIISAPSFKDRTVDWSGSRRDFVKYSSRLLSGAFVAGAVGTGWRYKDEAREMLEGRSAREEYDKYIKSEGFKEIGSTRKKELLGDTTSFSTIETQEFTPDEPGGLVDVVFSVEDQTYVVVTVEGDYDEMGSLPVVRAEFEGMEHIIPVFQTRFENSQTIALKTVTPGEHLIQFRRTDLSGNLEENGMAISVKTPDSLTPIGQAVLDCLPVIGMQKEFALSEDYNNDAPYFRNVSFYERESDKKIRLAFFEGRTAEDGGIGRNPQEMDRQLGRLFDFDHSVIVTLGTEDALLYELAHQEDRIRAHRIITDVIFPSGVDPKDIQERFYYHSVPDHGMVKRGLERRGNNDLLHKKVYSLYPDFYTTNNADIKAERLRVRKLIAVREQRREYEQRIDELAGLYQDLFIPENFPWEFETLAFLRKEEEQLMNE